MNASRVTRPAPRCLAHLALVAGVSGLAAGAQAGGTLLTFDDVGSLADYAPMGITFSGNASLWFGGNVSVLDDPDGGPYSVPYGLQFGNAGGELGSIFLASSVTEFSIWALSGPGDDLLETPMYIRGFTIDGTLVGEDNVDGSLQFDLLSISGAGIRRIDLFSPRPGSDVWDHATIVPAPGAVGALAAVVGCALQRRRR